MYVTPSEPQSVGGVIDDAIRLYRHSFSRCWLLGLAPAALFGAFLIALALWTNHVVAAHRGPAEIAAAGRAYRMVALGGDLVLMLVIGGFQGAIAACQAALARGDESVSTGRMLAGAFARVPIFILSVLLLYLAIAGGAAVLALLVALPAGWLLNHFHLLVRPVASAGLVAAVASSALYLCGRLQLFMIAIFVDRKGPLSCLTTSWHLTKGNWWRAMAILTVGIVIIAVLYVALVLLNYLGTYLTHFGVIYRVVVGIPLLVAFYALMYPMGPALWVAMYNDFKMRREGGDLAERLGALHSA